MGNPNVGALRIGLVNVKHPTLDVAPQLMDYFLLPNYILGVVELLFGPSQMKVWLIE